MQNKAKQSKTKQNKAKQSKTKQTLILNDTFSLCNTKEAINIQTCNVQNVQLKCS